jgi:catechol 2,3-dioxygenase
VRLQVSDLARSVDYYERVLGLRVFDRSPREATLGPHGDSGALVHLQEKRGVHPVPRHGAFGLYHFAILLPDRPSLGRFAAHVVAAKERLGMSDHLVSEALYLHDPDNLGIEVYADRPRSTWAHRNRELVMAVDPLDLEGLIAEGGQGARGEWRAPEGTSMGHVHLHVGDLDRASAFYHSALGFDLTGWSIPGALFLSAGGYHHHLGTNTWSRGPSASDDQARLLEWQLIVPDATAIADVTTSLTKAGYDTRESDETVAVKDPWGTELVVRY